MTDGPAWTETMAIWQRPARVALASFAVTFAVTLLYNMPDRDRSPAARANRPTDPAVVLESRGTRITLGDGSVIVADRQFGYADGSSRLLGVEVIVPAGEDGTGFRIRSGEAAGVEEAGEWTAADSVTIKTGDGLSGSTSEASYADATGVVTMPAPARFEQGWMRLAGEAARYDRRRGLVHLDRRAIVELRTVADEDASRTRIAAGTAEIDRLSGVMRFVEGATIEAAGRRMQAERVVVRFDPDASLLDAIELTGGARVLGRQGAEPDLREMSAQAITVTYREGGLERATLSGEARLQGRDTGPGRLRELSAPTIGVSYRDGAPEQATMTGGARVELFGDGSGAEGPAIDGGFVEMALEAGVAGIEELRAEEGVTLTFPADEGVPRHIRAQTLDIRDGSGGSDGRGEASPGLAAVFDGHVEMRESGAGRAASAEDARIMRAERLEAVLAAGLGRLTQARFLGNVTLDAGGIGARAEQATYAPADGVFTLVMADAGGPTPRMDDERGFVQARTLSIDLDGPNIEARQDVKGVLSEMEASDATLAVRPGLFAEGDPIHFVAGRFSYDAGTSLATYGAGARLWQGSTEFRGRRIVIDETTGNISARGTVQARTTMLQEDEESDEAVETATVGTGGTLSYDNRQRPHHLCDRRRAPQPAVHPRRRDDRVVPSRGCSYPRSDSVRRPGRARVGNP